MGRKPGRSEKKAKGEKTQNVEKYREIDRKKRQKKRELNPIISTCKECGVEFQAKRKDATLCDDCRELARQAVTEKECKHCGQVFTGRKQKIYCSVSCQRSAANQRYSTANQERIEKELKESRQTEITEDIVLASLAIHSEKPEGKYLNQCVVCGVEFRSDHYAKEVCSHECFKKRDAEYSKKQHTPKTFDEIPCVICDSQFTPKRKTEKYCSADCRAEAKRRMSRELMKSPEMRERQKHTARKRKNIKATCIVCGCDMTNMDDLRTNRYTCSAECRQEARKRRNRRTNERRKNVTKLMNPNLQTELAHVQNQSTEDLKDKLASLLARTADDLREMAAIVGELENRGEDLSALRLGIIDHLRRIASGQLLPEIVVKFSGFPALLKIASNLAIADQRKLTDGETVDMPVWRGNQIEWRKVDPLCLTRDQISLVFSGDRIRSQAEQVSVLESRRNRGVAEKKPAKQSRVRVDSERGGLVIGRSFATLEEILEALAKFRGTDFDPNIEGDESVVAVKMSSAEHRQLKIRAAKSTVGMAGLIRRAMFASGLIHGEED